MDRAAHILEAFEVPEPRTSRCGQADLFRQVSDLTVMPHVVVDAEAGIFRIAEDEQIKETREGGRCRERRRPAPIQARKFRLGLHCSGLSVVEPPILLLFAGKDLRQESQAVAASAATCSCERATSVMHRSRMSR